MLNIVGKRYCIMIEKINSEVLDTIKIGNEVLETVPVGIENGHLYLPGDENADAQSEESEKPKTRRQLKREKKLAKRRASYEKALKKDMRYRGPLSYRYLRAIAWFIIILTQVLLFLKIGSKLDSKLVSSYEELDDFLDGTKDMILPLFLVANFAYILDKKQSYKTMLVKYALLSAAVYIGIFLIYTHFVKGAEKALVKGGYMQKGELVDLISREGAKGGLCFNVFTDLFLCALFMFFLNYEPRRFFRGKKLYIFRAFAALPIAYEFICICLKILAFEEKVTIPIMMYPLMTTKPPMMIAFFIFMAAYIKKKEKRFLETGLTRKQYKIYEKTNTNSWHFSLRACRMCIRCAILDVFALVFVLVILIMNMMVQKNMSMDAAAEAVGRVPLNWGFGQTVNLLGMIPIFLLFSYSKSHKNNKIDIAMPFVAIIAIIYVYIEGIYRVLYLIVANGESAVQSIPGIGI